MFRSWILYIVSRSWPISPTACDSWWLPYTRPVEKAVLPALSMYIYQPRKCSSTLLTVVFSVSKALTAGHHKCLSQVWYHLLITLKSTKMCGKCSGLMLRLSAIPFIHFKGSNCWNLINHNTLTLNTHLSHVLEESTLQVSYHNKMCICVSESSSVWSISLHYQGKSVAFFSVGVAAKCTRQVSHGT